MFYCQYRIAKEDDEVLEFRYNRSHLYMNIIGGILLFSFYAIGYLDSIAMLFALGVGIMFLSLSAKPLIIRREITLYKKRKELKFIFGVRWIYIKKKVIPYNKINHIEISVSPLGNDGYHSSMKDTLYLNIKDEDKIKLGISCSEDYSNTFTYKLSETIGCKVITT